MNYGTVKWFNNVKGFGFITMKDSNEDIFVHYSVISMNGYKTLKQGQNVEFKLEQSEKGLRVSYLAPVELISKEAA